jgi:uncharacterized protein YfiM (DUF2279 family)
MIALALAVSVSLSGGDSTRISGVPLRPLPLEIHRQETAAPDHWLGEDKFRHFAMSYAITAFAYAGTRTVLDRDAGISIAIAAGSAAGLLKEFRDRSVGQPFSLRDLVWDAAGVALACVLVRQTR